MGTGVAKLVLQLGVQNMKLPYQLRGWMNWSVK
jgi:hypothetical protein